MNFDKLIKKLLLESSKIRGEYWIDDSGDVQFADGDIGDKNHSMIILQLEMSKLMDVFGIEFYDEAPTGMNELQSDDLQRIGDVLKKDGYWNPKEDDEEFGMYGDQYEAFEKYLHDNNPYKTKEQLDAAIAVVLSHSNSGNTDPRDYGMKWLGYIRVANNEIQTWFLRTQDLSNISRGIGNILDDIGIDEDETEDITFNVEVVSTKKYYEDVPLSDIESENVVNVALHESLKNEV